MGIKAKIEKLDTNGIDAAAMKFKESIQEFSTCCENMETITKTLLDSWDGKGKNMYETQYRILKGKLADINDELYDIYDELLAAEAAYGEADIQIAKEMM